MEYYRMLELDREPFSNAPDPTIFLKTRKHTDCLQKLEIAIRLRRGLNVIIGDVGTGKTTLCRQLVRVLADSQEVRTHLILDPSFESPRDCLAAISAMLVGDAARSCRSESEHKEAIKTALFENGVDERKLTVLIVDEGQKCALTTLEILRELLNFETNEHKLLQIVIFAQKEFNDSLRGYDNFADRINLYHELTPLSLRDTADMIRFRLELCRSGAPGSEAVSFTWPALWEIWRVTGGYPRKIIHLCHRILLTLLIQNRSRVTRSLVRSCRHRIPGQRKRFGILGAAASIGLISALAAFSGLVPLPEHLAEKIFQPAAISAPPPQSPLERIAPSATSDTQSDNHYPSVRHAVRLMSSPLAAPAPLPVANPGLMETTGRIGQTAATPYTRDATTPRNVSRPIRVEFSPGFTALGESSSVPAEIGKLRLQSRDSLWRAMQRVYGFCDTAAINDLLAVNPAITDADTVPTGTTVTLPAIRRLAAKADRKTWWISLGEHATLADAYRQCAEHADQLSLRVVPVQPAGGAFRYLLAAAGPFFNPDAADQALNNIAPSTGMRSFVTVVEKENLVFTLIEPQGPELALHTR